jgi:hypothetical protein
VWLEFACGRTARMGVGGDNFCLNAEGLLMPARKD